MENSFVVSLGNEVVQSQQYFGVAALDFMEGS